MTDLYTVLGVDREADADTIKQAYRRRAQANHPDKGGDKEAFQQIQAAYDVLGDPVKRSRYDATGKTDAPPDPTEKAFANVADLFLQAINGCDLDAENIVNTMLKAIAGGKESTLKQKKVVQNNIVRQSKALKKIKRKAGGENRLLVVLEASIARLNQEIAALDDTLAMTEIMRKIVEDYEYELPPPPPPRQENPYGYFFTMEEVARAQGEQSAIDRAAAEEARRNAFSRFFK